MDFSIFTAPDIGPWLFAGLCFASFATALLGTLAGAAGGLILLALMANVLRPEVLIPVHTVVQLGQGISRTLVMRKHVVWETVTPFVIGAVAGAIAGAKIFVALPMGWLQLILGFFILLVTWIPKLGRIGGVNKRFIGVGFAATFLGVFVSATGTLIAPVIAAASPTRHNHAATLGILMSITHTLKLMAFLFVGLAIGAYLPLMAGMILTGAVGNWMGERALLKMPEERFRLIFQICLTILGVRLLWMAAQSAGWV